MIWISLATLNYSNKVTCDQIVYIFWLTECQIVHVVNLQVCVFNSPIQTCFWVIYKRLYVDFVSFDNLLLSILLKVVLVLIFPLSCDHSRFSCFNVIQCILKSNEKHWCHDMTRLKWPYLSANTTVAPDKITNKIVYILSVQTLSKMASKVISNSRIPFSSTARKARYFGIKRLCDMVTWSFDRASLGCTRPWGFRY